MGIGYVWVVLRLLLDKFDKVVVWNDREIDLIYYIVNFDFIYVLVVKNEFK